MTLDLHDSMVACTIHYSHADTLLSISQFETCLMKGCFKEFLSLRGSPVLRGLKGAERAAGKASQLCRNGRGVWRELLRKEHVWGCGNLRNFRE